MSNALMLDNTAVKDKAIAPEASIEKFDYIIVGAGSAGCVLATRLTEDKDVTVLLVEAGLPDYRLDFRIHMPAALAYPLQGKTYNWYFQSEPDPFMNNRRMYCPRGKTLGGSSSINGMVYIRGHALDFERWAAETSFADWDYQHCLAYFKKAERFSEGANTYHGGDGYLGVQRGEMQHPLFGAFVEAGKQAGYAETDDLNGYRQAGFGPMDRTTFNSRRHSTARSYLAEAKNRPNLEVRTRQQINKIVIHNDKAIGVEIESGGKTKVINASREVIVSAGSIGSPKLLMLSGIGDAEDLQAHGIRPLKHLPGVGQNLQDHLETYVQYACKEPITLYKETKWYRQLKIGFEWLFLRRGVGASNHFEAGAFISSQSRFSHPNLQYHFMPIAMHYDGSEMQGQHGFQAHVGPMRPESRGHVKLANSDPNAPPSILFNYMSTENDRQEMRDAIRLTRDIFQQAAFDEYRAEELAPGVNIQSDDEIDNFIRDHAESAMHPSCTCKMGDIANDPMAVVNGEGQVYGFDGLRVIDSSIMPSIVSGNLNATTIMLAEKIADKMRGLPHAKVEEVTWYEKDVANQMKENLVAGD